MTRTGLQNFRSMLVPRQNGQHVCLKMNSTGIPRIFTREGWWDCPALCLDRHPDISLCAPGAIPEGAAWDAEPYDPAVSGLNGVEFVPDFSMSTSPGQRAAGALLPDWTGRALGLGRSPDGRGTLREPMARCFYQRFLEPRGTGEDATALAASCYNVAIWMMAAQPDTWGWLPSTNGIARLRDADERPAYILIEEDIRRRGPALTDHFVFVPLAHFGEDPDIHEVPPEDAIPVCHRHN
jgi:hypothetical protein